MIGPHVNELTQRNLKQDNFATASTETSYHGNIELFPVLVRYFLPTEGVRVKILDISAEGGESSDVITY